jgi:hypothetical protein
LTTPEENNIPKHRKLKITNRINDFIVGNGGCDLVVCDWEFYHLAAFYARAIPKNS